MSGQGKKGGKKSGYTGDVTLADFANSTAPRNGKPGKAKSTFNLLREVNQLNIQELPWDEQPEDLEDFQYSEEHNDDRKGDVVERKGRRRKTKNESSGKSGGNGNDYPIDIWHLIAQYIRPEDTVTFASICTTAWEVVNSPTYWLNMYKRYYKNVPNLPARLKPECMVRHHGLKACVIRALYYMYPPLAARVDLGTMSTPYDLRSRQCISFWQQKVCSKWRLCFKMRRKDCLPKRPSNDEKPDLMEILEDIFANADDGCTILQVVSLEKTMPPAVMGLTLHSIQMKSDLISASMHVQLVFGSGRICNGQLDPTNTVTLSLKTVQQVSVLDWWHPRYPHSPHTIVSLCDDT